ncbi:PEP-CTERM sorting domain-containing protein [sulfur-oxidizing endosymbiont of Gigantopelta aegis]|uniref:PEP-CTERM sorting domain-containing protein n=1 Tax=sulfur-oxidizing endosymbiont of Gigantopelta aegis TaxID=2794934 RepID=UPI0018DCEAA5|nr:PEP-CTERM sorting domain-containing protein [sulfur-oxidizing endosymbiont of Gigantopelta aegis]
MKIKRLLTFIVFFSVASTAGATVIRGAESVSNTVSKVAAGYGVINTINQSGLSDNYNNGITDFDTFTNSVTGASHIYSAENNEWYSELDATETIDYYLGRVFTVDKIAIWNEDWYGISSVSIFASNDASFTNILSLGNFSVLNGDLTDNAKNVNYFADVLSFTAVNASYIRLELTGVTYTDQNGNAFTYTSMGEVAFSVIPEPSSLALLAFGLVGVGFTRKKK